MTVFEYIISMLPGTFAFKTSFDDWSIDKLFLDFEHKTFEVVPVASYFVVRVLPDDKRHYTDTQNKHELLGLLVELTK